MNRSLQTIVLIVIAISPLQTATSVGIETNGLHARIQQAVASHDTTILVQIVPDVENLWQEPVAYFHFGGQIAFLLSEIPRNLDAMRSLTILFTNMLCKPCPTNNEQAISCFDVKREVVLHCLNVDQIRNDKALLMAIARFVGEVRSRMVLNYRNRGTAQPGRDILQEAGVRNPNFITNAVLKQAYEKAVKENEQDLIMNRLQLALFEANQTVTFHLLSVCAQVVKTNPKDEPFINQIISNARLTEDERKKLQ